MSERFYPSSLILKDLFYELNKIKYFSLQNYLEYKCLKRYYTIYEEYSKCNQVSLHNELKRLEDSYPIRYILHKRLHENIDMEFGAEYDYGKTYDFIPLKEHLSRFIEIGFPSKRHNDSNRDWF